MIFRNSQKPYPKMYSSLQSERVKNKNGVVRELAFGCASNFLSPANDGWHDE